MPPADILYASRLLRYSSIDRTQIPQVGQLFESEVIPSSFQLLRVVNPFDRAGAKHYPDVSKSWPILFFSLLSYCSTNHLHFLRTVGRHGDLCQ